MVFMLDVDTLEAEAKSKSLSFDITSYDDRSCSMQASHSTRKISNLPLLLDLSEEIHNELLNRGLDGVLWTERISRIILWLKHRKKMVCLIYSLVESLRIVLMQQRYHTKRSRALRSQNTVTDSGPTKTCLTGSR